jgi:hypothetical protein
VNVFVAANCHHKDAQLTSQVVVKVLDNTAGAVKAWQKITKITRTCATA